KLLAAAAKLAFGGDDRSEAPRGIGPDRERPQRGEVQVALDGESEREADACDLAKREAAEFGRGESEIGEPEQRVAVGVELGREPCCCADGREKFDDRERVGLDAAAFDGAAMRGGIGVKRGAKSEG